MSPQARRALASLSRLANQLEPRTRDAFQRALEKLQLAADVDAAAKALASGDVDGAVRALMPANATAVFTHELTVAIATLITEVGPQTAREIASIVRVNFQFVPGSPAAARALQQMDLAAILPMTQDAEKGLRAVLTDGLLKGENPRVVARAARSFVGLTSYDAGLLHSFEQQARNDPAMALTRELRDKRYDTTLATAIDGAPLTEAQVATMRDAYTRKLIAWRAETWSRTTTLQALRETQTAAWFQAADDLNIPTSRMLKTWITTLDGRERPTHHALSGNTVPIDQPFANGDMVPGDGTGVEGEEFNCLVGDMRIVAPDCIAATRRVFDGETVTIHTAAGHKLTVTPNHPILTPNGWVAAGGLHKGDQVVKSVVGEWASATDHDGENVPTSIQDVAESLFLRFGETGHCEVVTTAADFHGDATDGDVAVIVTDRELLCELNTALREHTPELLLVSRLRETALVPGDRSPQHAVRSAHASATRGMGGGSLCSALFGVHQGPLDSLSIGMSARVDSSSDQPSPNNTSANAEAGGDAVFALPARVPRDNRVGVKFNAPTVPSGAHCHVPCPTIDAVLDESLANNPIRDAEDIGDLLKTLAGLVTLDDVALVERHRFRGHVYNLETVRGWYIAEGIITHNCRCSMVVRLAAS